MKVVITGGAGFLGMRLARALLQRGTLTDGQGQDQPITRLTLVDVTEPPAALNDDRIARMTGDISDHSLLQSIIDRETGSIFHLAAIVSGMAEADFDLGMRINVDATRALLEAARAAGHQPRVVFTSSVAVYGGELPALITDTTALNPQTSVRHRKGDRRAAGRRLHEKGIRRRPFPRGSPRSPCGPAVPMPPRRRSPAASSASR